MDIVTMANTAYNTLYIYLKIKKMDNLFQFWDEMDHKHKYYYIILTKKLLHRYVNMNPKTIFEYWKKILLEDKWKYDDEFNPYRKWHPWLVDWKTLTEKERDVFIVFACVVFGIRELFKEVSIDGKF